VIPARFYLSHPILEEYADVLSRQELGIRKAVRQQLLQLIRNGNLPETYWLTVFTTTPGTLKEKCLQLTLPLSPPLWAIGSSKRKGFPGMASPPDSGTGVEMLGQLSLE
jgi:hypothetical protein